MSEKRKGRKPKWSSPTKNIGVKISCDSVGVLYKKANDSGKSVSEYAGDLIDKHCGTKKVLAQ